MPVTNLFKVQNKLQHALEQVSAHEENDRGITRLREKERERGSEHDLAFLRREGKGTGYGGGGVGWGVKVAPDSI